MKQIYPRIRKHHASKKACAICEKVKPIDSFHYLKANDTRHSYCRPCHSAYMASRYHQTKRVTK